MPKAASPPVDPRPPAFLLFGVPDSRRAAVAFNRWDQPPKLVLEGMATLTMDLANLPWQGHMAYFGMEPLVMNTKLPRLPSISFLADADLYPLALRQASEFVRRVGLPCFNHPDAVAATTRDGVARLLTGIPGLTIPATVRVRAARLSELQDAMRRGGIGYPVLVRMPGSHGGQHMVRVDDASAWDAINTLAWGGRDVYLTQYVDYRDDDGRFRKLRLVVVGSRLLVRSQMVSDQWLVNASARRPDSAPEERAFLQGVAAGLDAKLTGVLSEIARRLRLDFFGVDASLRPDGSLLLFEANASMNMLINPHPQPNMWEKPVSDIQEALRSHLADSAAWCAARAAGPELFAGLQVPSA